MPRLTLTGAQIKTKMLEGKGVLNESHKDAKAIQYSVLDRIPSTVKQLDALRQGDKDRRPIDITLGEFARDKWGFALSANGSPDAFFAALGVDPSRHSIESLMSMPEMPEGYRWLVPEVIREAIRLGLQKNPIYPSLIAAEENVTQPTVIMPSIKSSRAVPKKVGEAETIPVGNDEFNQKTVTLHKAAVGLKITDEVAQYVAINILSLFLQEAGIQLNLALDTMAIETLINGDQINGSNAITRVGVDTIAEGITYDKDLLLAWIKMGRLGKTPAGMLSNEQAALNILALPEFKGYNGMTQLAKIQLETPVPTAQKYWIHGAMPVENKVILIDNKSALIKLNSASLKVESERIAERQLTGTYVTVTTGFANLFNDGRLMIDGTTDLASQPYPPEFDASEAEKISID